MARRAIREVTPSTPRSARHACVAAMVAATCAIAGAQSSQQPLTQLQFDIVGIRLTVDPATLTVPKGIPTFINTKLETGQTETPDTAVAIANLTTGAFVEAELRGPSITPTRLIARPGQPLVLPAFALPGDYFLDQIRLVKDGRTIMDAQPSAVPIKVINEVFITTVSSRPLSLSEIQEKGIVIDEKNFQIIEFQIAFDVGGRQFKIDMPTALPTPTFLGSASQEIVKLSLLGINQQLAETVRLPPELDLPGLNFSIAPLPFFRVDDEEEEKRFGPPPIAGLVVIPGSVGFLNQFFSAIVVVTNVAPADTPLVLRDVEASLTLPVGKDGVAGTFDLPGDDPLRLARIAGVGTLGRIAIVQAGPDGTPATFDDVTFIGPQQSGEGEFLVEGLQEGGHTLDIGITAVLHGLPSGPVRLAGQAAGAVLVRNPNFALALGHPRTIRAGEPYSIFATVTNTSKTVANLVSVNLDPRGISGAQLLSDPAVVFDTLAAGESATAQFRLLAQKTGQVNFSSVNTGKGLTGSFQLTTGIGERGIPLAPNAIVLPGPASALPDSLIYAAQRVLGQAFSIATAPAGALPPDVLFVRRQTVIDRAVELGEAGQRLQLGESRARVIQDLLLDWMGNRAADDGFDQLLRTTGAGAAFMREVARLLAPEAASGVLDYLHAFSQASVHRAPHLLAITGSGGAAAPVRLSIADAGGLTIGETVSGDQSSLTYSDLLRLSEQDGRSELAVVSRLLGTRYLVQAVGDASGTFDLGLSVPAGPGRSRHLQYSGVQIDVGDVVTVIVDLASSASPALQVDLGGDGTVDRSIAAQATDIVETAPRLLVLRQLPEVLGKGPENIGDYAVSGLIVAALFDKPVRADAVESLENYSVDGGNTVNAVAMQASGRLAYLLLRKGIGTFVQRSITIRNVEDERGHVMDTVTQPIEAVLNQGARVSGQVRSAIGDPVPGALLTLLICCVAGDTGPVPVAVSQIRTDIDGAFQFDYVTRFGTNFLVEVMHPVTLERATLQARVRGAGEQILLNLTFIGRGWVTGRVLEADGVTPVPNVPIILTPEPNFSATDAQRVPKGTVTNDVGEYVFVDVPVGNYTVKARDTRGFFGEASGTLPSAGLTGRTDVILAVDPAQLGRVTGRVFRSDGQTAVVGATVYIGRRSNFQADAFVAIGRTLTDEAGAFSFEDVPKSDQRPYEVVAIDPATQQLGDGVVDVLPARTNALVIVMQATGSVQGVVRDAQGQLVAGALVAGGAALGVTDANGVFVIDGVPAGDRTIEAGDPVTKRRGQTSLTVLPAQTVTAEIILEARATIFGRVLDAQGNPVPKATVRLPQSGGFIFVFANNEGFYKFPDLALGDYLIQAPGPDQAALITYMKSKGIDPRSAFTMGDIPPELGGTTTPQTPDEILNAYKDALRTYLKLDDPFIVGPPPIPGGGFGWNKVRLLQDSITVTADVKYLPQGQVDGRTLDANGVPTGALVRVNTLTVSPSGQPKFTELARKNSDAQTGAFAFDGIPRFDLLTFQATGIRAGDFSLEAATPFSPVIAQFAGQLSPNTPNLSGIELRFPAASETNGTISGLVLMPDGVTPAPENTEVTISFGDLTVRTDAQGRFRSALPIPGNKYYSVTARHPTAALQEQIVANVPAGGNVDVTIRLLGLGGVKVTVRRPDGTLLVGTPVKLERGAFPAVKLEAITNAAGQVSFVNVPEGSFSVLAEEPITGLTGRSGAVALRDADVAVTVVIAASGRVIGIFLQADGVTPVVAAQVVLRSEAGVEAYAVTDGAGRFELLAIPATRFTVSGRHLLTGRQGQTTGELRFEGDVVAVTLLELAAGRVEGFVLQANGVDRVAGATVGIGAGPGFNPMSLQVSARADGSFTFEGVPVGPFSLTAQDPATLLKGTAAGLLSYEGERVSQEILLEPVGTIRVRVLDASGVPVPNARIELAGANRVGATNPDGEFVFDLVSLGSYSLKAHSLTAGREHDGGVTSVKLDAADQVVEATIRFRGIGRVLITVVASDGTTPVPSARVTLTAQGSNGDQQPGAFAGSFVGFTGADGNVTLPGVPVGVFFVRAESALLSGLSTGVIASPEQDVAITVQLIPSGTVRGRLLLPDGLTPAAHAFVTLTFPPRSSFQSGKLQVTTDLTGTFSFAAIPLGPFTIAGFEVVSKGVRTFAGTLTADGEVHDVGDLVLDNLSPRVVSMSPTPGANGARATAPIVLTFSEPMRPGSVGQGNVGVREGSLLVPGALAFSNGNQTLTFTPEAPLKSMTGYTVTVRAAPDGPEDTEGFKLLDPFVASFVVEDTTPPGLVSTSPAAAAVGVVPEAVVRFAFTETIASGFVLTVSGPSGAVAGVIVTALGGTVIIFTPTAYLAPNATYTASLIGVQDLAGNTLAGGPVSIVFSTIDTLAPEISALDLVGSPSRIAGSVITVRPTIAVVDVVRVEYLDIEGNSRIATTPPYDGTFVLPTTQSSTEIVAVAVDASGNRSSAARLVVEIRPNAPPTAVLINLSGITRPAPGQKVTFQVSATDDVALAELVFSAAGAVSASAGALATGGPAEFTTTFDLTIPAGATGSFTVQGAAVDSVGNRSTPSALQFEVGESDPPVVVSTDPADGAVDVPLIQAITVVFNEPVLAESVTATSLAVSVAGVAVAGTRSVDGSTIAFAPTAPWPAGAEVVVLLSSIRDLAGNSMAAKTIRFRTLAASLSLTSDADALVAAGRTIVATVTLPSDAPAGGTVVTVSSASPSIVSVTAPGTVTIAAGTRTGTIALTAVAPGTARVTAAASGFNAAFIDIVVTNRALGVPATLTTVVGETAELAISIQPAPTGPLAVSVTSSDPAVLAIFTPTVNVSAGQAQATASVRMLQVGAATVTVSAATYASGRTFVSGGATLDIADESTAMAAGLPASIPVRLLAGTTPVAAPAGGIALTVASDNVSCVTAAAVTLPAGSPSIGVPLTATPSATLPCSATITVQAEPYGSDSIRVTVFAGESVYSATTAVSFYNPAPVPPPGGFASAGSASVSYYNPAALPVPGGTNYTGTASVSFYNPAQLPNPTGSLTAGTTSASYYNPAPPPSPSGTLMSGTTSVSYDNPSVVTTAVAPASGSKKKTSGGSAKSTTTQQDHAETQPAAATIAVSVANGPVASFVSPSQLSRTIGVSVTLTITGSNLRDATSVRLVGLEQDVVIDGTPQISEDGTTLIVHIFVLPTAKLGPADVIVVGPGWMTLNIPQMRVEIVQ